MPAPHPCTTAVCLSGVAVSVLDALQGSTVLGIHRRHGGQRNWGAAALQPAHSLRKGLRAGGMLSPGAGGRRLPAPDGGCGKSRFILLTNSFVLHLRPGGLRWLQCKQDASSQCQGLSTADMKAGRKQTGMPTLTVCRGLAGLLVPSGAHGAHMCIIPPAPHVLLHEAALLLQQSCSWPSWWCAACGLQNWRAGKHQDGMEHIKPAAADVWLLAAWSSCGPAVSAGPAVNPSVPGGIYPYTSYPTNIE